MAFCTNCKAEIGMMDSVCKACGHEFSEGDVESAKPGWEYSTLADAILFSGLVVAVVGFGVSCLGIPYALFEAGPAYALVSALAADVCAVFFVLILRNIKR